MSEPWLCGAGAGEGGGVEKQQMETKRCRGWQSPGGVGHPENHLPHPGTSCVLFYILFVYMCVL